ncbi:MAG: DUF115 domain-containing protein, partial [Phycisphaerales bacterium]|nr:DUF115 domain-containing protein [Phycisphaerales bacterium]
MTSTAAVRVQAAPSSERVLRANLAAIARLCPDTAERIERASARGDVEFAAAGDGALTARAGGRLLASAKRPLEEAERLASSVDVREAAGVVVMGFGVGHHVGAMARRLGREGLLVVFEPDVGLLRAALERVDCSEWMRETNFALLTEPDDGAALSGALQGLEALLAMGVEIVEHAPSRDRLGEGGAAFGRTLARVMSAVRTNVVTTMMQTETTVRNTLMNLDRYVSGDGVAELAGLFAGRAAVVVSAGPSLARNVALLARPGVRERVVIVAVQTALKPLLSAGVRPHFVTALDHHEISRRFYEGLTERDVAGVTLIAEPKANPAILDAFPGMIRCPGDTTLNLLLGEPVDGTERHGTAPCGATVARLAYYIARLLGCDPVALVGQDLGFTDGQYYAGGAAIHEVWGAELNEFRTLEMFEWERIVRSRSILRRAADHLGRPIYTDEQMATYLAQFERDFKADEARGLRTVDATEGGVRKAYTSSASLGEFLDEHAAPGRPELPAIPAARRGRDERAIRAAEERVRAVRGDVWKIARLSRDASPILGRMLEVQRDQRRVGELIDRVYAMRDEAVSLQPAYELTHRFNQTGAFNRARTDRGLRLEESLEPVERQARQIERDRKNLEWLAAAGDAFGSLLDDAVKALRGGPKKTRDEAPVDAVAATRSESRRVSGAAAVIVARSDELPALARTVRGENLLRATLRRLSAMRTVRRAVILTDDATGVRALLAGAAPGIDVTVEPCDGAALRARMALTRAGRLWSPACWRGGLGGLTIYDEAMAPEAAAPAMERLNIDAALVVGGGWALVDPALCDEVMERHLEQPDRRRIAFSQAAPGLCGCVVDRHVMGDLAQSAARAGAFASLGGLLGYLPIRPKADAIAMPVCVQVDPAARDVGLRLIGDTSAGAALLERIGQRLGDGVWSADAAGAARAAREAASVLTPREAIVELTTSRVLDGARRRWAAGGAEREPGALMTEESFRRALGPLCAAREDVVVTFAGAGDPILHPRLPAFVALARESGGRELEFEVLQERIHPAQSRIDMLSEKTPAEYVAFDLLAL